MIVLPFVNAALAAHPAYQHSLTALANVGVHILTGSDGVLPHPPGTGGPLAESFPWHLALDAASASCPAPRSETGTR